MRSFLSYVDELKEKQGITSDEKMSEWLGANRSQIGTWRNRGSRPEDYYCIVIAEKLGIHPLEVIAEANAERENNQEKRDFWEDFMRRHASQRGSVTLEPLLAVGLVSAGLVFTINHLDLHGALTNLCIMLSCKGRKHPKRFCNSVYRIPNRSMPAPPKPRTVGVFSYAKLSTTRNRQHARPALSGAAGLH